jgi:hypothetical protein
MVDVPTCERDYELERQYEQGLPDSANVTLSQQVVSLRQVALALVQDGAKWVAAQLFTAKLRIAVAASIARVGASNMAGRRRKST